MNKPLSRQPDEVEEMIRTYGDMLFRTCLVMLQNQPDAEDAVQETVLKYMLKAPTFSSPEHEKSWLLKVAANHCRDMLRFRSRHPQITLDELAEYLTDPENCGILDALMTIPEKYQIVMLLHYVEGYPTDEIAQIIGRTPSAVKMRLKKGRKLLEEAYRKEN
ncbi:MAG TPA: sigma-70 family RNA polymerase sigma factor [Candidatus Faecivivens stercoripullorum]|uniref:Sigma-70 family RNA polymerase sigma factor n=1 Tax=Candidatus Faecivivens stercoripullorum TaxID=2840805 RepID=A0A9D1H635_9FIRM|nr:sigma-70 family RNA polymerase sigma factor [Candidatus Faecivivens stercoripullorum]